MQNRSEIVRNLLDSGIKQQELADFLGVTRQSIKRCADGRELSSRLRKFELLEPLSLDDQKNLIAMDKMLSKIVTGIANKPETIEKAVKGFEYMQHWCTDPKYPSKFINYLFGHIVNFHMRFSPYTLLMRDFFEKEDRLLLTLNIDYDQQQIIGFCLLSFKENEIISENLACKNEFPISFERFIDELFRKIGDRVSINIYGDVEDDELGFIEKNIHHDYKQKFSQISVYDLSKMFNYFDHRSPVGPQIEDVLENFHIEFDKQKLLTDCQYRGRMIIRLINMVSLSDMREKQKVSDDIIFNGSSKNSPDRFVEDKRRKMKRP